MLLGMRSAGARAYSPVSLFSAGEQGVFYDPSDLTTLFQDAAGTTPVTAVEQPVGLMLDKSKGLVLGPELVTNGGPGFVNTTGWTYTGGAGGGASVVSGDLVANAASALVSPADRCIRFTISGLTVGVRYKIVYAIKKGTAPEARLTMNTSPAGGDGGYFALASSASPTVSGVYHFPATATTHYLELYAAGGATAGQTAILSSVSVRELPGNHATQSTAASRPVLSARVNLLTKTHDLRDAAWTKQSGTTVDTTAVADPSGALTAWFVTGNGTSGVFQGIAGSTNLGQSVRSVYLRTRSGTATVSIKDPAQTQGVTSCSVTTTWQRFTLTEATTATGGFAAGIWIFNIPASGIEIAWPDVRVANDGVNLPVYQRVNTATDYDTTGFPVYLRADGVDDSLVTSSIAFTGGAATSFWGMRNTGGTQWVPIWRTADSPGSFWAVATQSSASSPTGGGVGGAASYRVNGQTMTPVTRGEVYNRSINRTTVMTTESLTLPSGSLTIGGYFDFPLNARLYSLIVLGRTATPTEITNTETWVNDKTKAF